MFQKIINNLSQKWAILPILGLATYLLTKIAFKNPGWVEAYYSQIAYPKIAFVFSTVSNIFPFSLDDLFYILLIIALFSLIILLLFHKISYKKAGKIIMNTLASVYILFYVLWGFNYFREDLNNRLNLNEQTTNADEFILQLKILIENTNNSFCVYEELDKNQVDTDIEESYKKLAPVLKLKYPAGKRNDKKITFSSFFAKAGISGYYGPFFNEVHVNSKVLPVEYPFVLAHEKAHQIGVTSEAEANFFAWLVCTLSNSKQLQYSANLNILRFFLYQGYRLEEYPEIIKKLDEKVVNDFQLIRENWMNLRNEKVDKVASKVNDTYLKSNKVEKGIEDYRGVVKFVMDYSQDSTFQKKHNLLYN